MIYDARELARLCREDPDRLWQIPDGPIKVRFDDGVLDTYTRPTIISAYMWRLYLELPKTPALMRHHMGNGRFNDKTHKKLLGDLMWDAYDAYEGNVDIDELSRKVYQDTNRIYNDFTYALEEWVQGLSIIDFVEVLHHPVIKAANENVMPNDHSINKVYKTIRQVLLDPKELPGNSIAEVAKNGLVSMTQIEHCVGPRGSVTEVDSNLFRYPLLTGYAEGIRGLYESLAESRSAAKSLSFTEKPLQETEYFNREMQLMASTLARIYPGDCGSTTYLHWTLQSGDLKSLAGKYYLNNGKLEILQASDLHLVGETLPLRSVFYCMHPDSNGVCARCYGDMALSIPRGTNIGHVAATALCEQTSQKVLSVKHQDSASASEGVEFSPYHAKYLRSKENQIMLAERLEGARIKMTVSGAEAKRLVDITFVDSVIQLPEERISKLTEVRLDVDWGTDRPPETAVVPASAGTWKGSLSHSLLSYAKLKRWEVTPNGDYVFDLSDWDVELPLFVMPLKHANMLDYMRLIKTYIRATKEKKSKDSKGPKTLADAPTVLAALQEFHWLVSSELNVNIVHLEVLIKSTMIRSRKCRDHRLPLFGNEVIFAPFTLNMNMRSLSATLAYEKQRDALNNPITYLATVRPDHPLDALVAPPL